MYFCSTLRSKLFFLTTLFAAILLCAVFSGVSAQVLPGIPNIGAVDPLRFDFGRETKNTGVLSNNNLTGRENRTLAAGELDTSFDVPFDFEPGEIRSSARQSDGKLLIGGFFRTLNSSHFSSIVRLNTDNSIDPSFAAAVNGTVFAIAVQTDGKILIGGAFTVANGNSRYRLARLNPNGSLDSSFDIGDGINRPVLTIAVQTDGKILFGGSFEFVSNFTVSYYIARLNSDGSPDTSFNSGVRPTTQLSFLRTTINSIALQADGKILLGGLIIPDPLNPFDTTPIMRLNPDGSIDSHFNPVTAGSNPANKVIILPGGKILLGGLFDNINGVARKYLARLNQDGVLDTSFDATDSIGLPVYSLYLKNDGKILVGSLINTLQPGFIKQLNADGSPDIDFEPNAELSGSVNTINLTANGKVFTGGTFRLVSGGTPNTALIFDPDGSLDQSFVLNSTAIGGVRAVIALPDGKILVGGNFNRVRGVFRDKLVKLNSDGTIDQSFPANAVSALQLTTLLRQPDGKIIIGGTLVGTGPVISGSVARINPDGSPDPTFVADQPSLGRITAMALQPDGKILIAYSNSTVFRDFPGGNILRLNADGSLDDTFSSSLNSAFDAIAVQPDGKILVGGAYGTGVGNQFQYGIFRLNADGSRDGSFSSGFDTDFDFARFTKVYAIQLQPDGKMIVGGELYVEGIAQRIGVARLASNGVIDQTFQTNPIFSVTEYARIEDLKILHNGKVVFGGRFDVLGAGFSLNVARINADGTIDSTFSAAAGRTVYEIELQTNGNVLIGGDFESVNGSPRTSLARLLSEPLNARRAPFDFDGDNRTDVSIFRPAAGEWWYLRSSDAGNRAFQFGSSSDKPVPADFTGDGKTDIAVWRESTGGWFVLRSEDSSFYSFPFGASGDIPVPGDFDGDGRSDPAVFRPSSQTWFILNSGGGTTISQFGASGDLPVVGDYDGDNKDDIAVFRPSNGTWWLNRSTNGMIVYNFGTGTDKTVQADYTGDSKTDVAFFRPGSGEWFVLKSEDASFYSFPFGASGDIPVPGDYDGDGKADAAVFRPSGNTWYKLQSASGFEAVTFGVSGDVPVPSVFVR